MAPVRTVGFQESSIDYVFTVVKCYFIEGSGGVSGG